MTFTGLSIPLLLSLMLGCAGVLVILHLLRVRPREVRVVTTLFWKRAKEGRRSPTLLHRFRHPLTYLFLLLICMLLCLALGQPESLRHPDDRIHVVYILDGSPSMTVTDGDGGRSRFDYAAGLLEDHADGLSLDDRVGLIVVDPLPRLAHGFDDPRPALRKQMDRKPGCDLPGARGPALRLACSMLSGRSNPRILLFTDRPADHEFPAPGSERPPVEVILVGERSANAAISGALYEPDPSNPFSGRLSVHVEYFGGEPLEVRLQILNEGGALLLDRKATVQPEEIRSFSLDGLAPDGDLLEIRLDPPDALVVDNRARFHLPSRSLIRIRTGTGLPEVLLDPLASNPWIQIADPDGDRDIDVLSGALSAALLNELSDKDSTAGRKDLDRPSIVIVDSGAPAPLFEPVEIASTGGVEGRDPWVRDLDFEGATCGTGPILGDGTIHGTPLLEAGGAVLAARTDVRGTPCLFLASSLLAQDASVWKRGAFAVFMARALAGLAGWDGDPHSLPSDRRVVDPLWPARSGWSGPINTLPGGHESSNLWREVPPGSGHASVDTRRAMPEPFEILLALAGILFVIETVLHVRGRIS